MKPGSSSSLRQQTGKSLFSVFKWTVLFFTIILIIITATGFRMLGNSISKQIGQSLARELSSSSFLIAMGIDKLSDLNPESDQFKDWIDNLSIEGLDIKTGDAVIILNKPLVFVDLYLGDRQVFSNRQESFFIIPMMQAAAQGQDRSSDFSPVAYLYRNWSFSSYYPILDSEGQRVGMVQTSTDPEFFLIAVIVVLVMCGMMILILMYAARYLSFYLAQPIIAPLARLESEMRALAEDNFEQVVHNGVMVASDLEEIQALTDATNSLINKLKFLSMHDPLTGIYNRAYFEEEMQRLSTVEGPALLGIIMCDLDKLKLANDTLGHKAGDFLLCKAAMILKTAVRDDDVVARIGGDEFAIFLHACTVEEVEQVLARIREKIELFNNKSGVQLGISMGYAHGCLSEHDVADILKEADNQMYMDKGAMIQGMLLLKERMPNERRGKGGNIHAI